MTGFRGWLAGRPAAALAAVVASVLLLLLQAGPTEAGGYGLGRPSRLGLYPEKSHYFNHVAAPSVPASRLPRELNWCNHKDISYCTSSWNQHIPLCVRRPQGGGIGRARGRAPVGRPLCISEGGDIALPSPARHPTALLPGGHFM